MKARILPFLVASLVGATPIASAAPFADLVFVVDESGSMDTEHAWLGTMVAGLDAGLVTRGLAPNLYGLTGFGAFDSNPPHAVLGHKHSVGSGDFGTSAEFSLATADLVTDGSREDGWQALTFAATSYAYRTGSARNLILVTDENRDDESGPTITFASTQQAIQSIGGILNVVIEIDLQCGDGSVALGISGGGVGYKADGAGGFTTCSGATATGGDGLADYYPMALNLGGAAWDLNQLRAGGLAAQSFTAAFVAIKVEEIVSASEPTTLALLGLSLIGLFAGSRRIARAA